MSWQESRRDFSTAVFCHFTMLFLLLFRSVQLETKLVEPFTQITLDRSTTRNNIVKSYFCKFHVCARHFEITSHLPLIKICCETSDKTVVVKSSNTLHKFTGIPVLAMIALSAVQSSAQTFIHNDILFNDISNNAWYKQAHWLIRTPYLSIIASNNLEKIMF